MVEIDLTFIEYSMLGMNNRKLYFRKNNSDPAVIKQIFERKDYNLGALLRAKDINNEYLTIINNQQTPLIIDCGANIGASSIWFHSLFPKSKIIAIEPDKDSFELLVKNTFDLPITPIHAAISNIPGRGILVDGGNGAWSNYIANENRPDVKGQDTQILDMKSILKQEANNKPFLVKIDIEGGEKQLFESNTEWFDQFYLAIIELHDWLFPKKRTSQNFLKTIASLNRDFVSIEENIFSIQNKD